MFKRSSDQIQNQAIKSKILPISANQQPASKGEQIPLSQQEHLWNWHALITIRRTGNRYRPQQNDLTARRSSQINWNREKSGKEAKNESKVWSNPLIGTHSPSNRANDWKENERPSKPDSEKGIVEKHVAPDFLHSSTNSSQANLYRNKEKVSNPQTLAPWSGKETKRSCYKIHRSRG